MRLAIINLTGGGFSGGYRKYLKNMIPLLAEHAEVDKLMCVSAEGNDISGWFPSLKNTDYGECRRFSLPHLAFIPDRKMSECLRKFSPDVIFLPVDRYVRPNNLPVVNMVRNMEPLVPNMRGDTLREILKKYVLRKVICQAVRRADHTIAVSGYVKNYLMEKLQIPEDKISQVYHGLTSQTGDCIRRPHSLPVGWDSGFLFTCGSVRPARGLEDLIGALTDLRLKKIDMRLVIAGETLAGMRKYRKSLERHLALKQLTDSVCWAGTMSEEELRWCYNKCSLFVMTSRVEACPNIALEAMANGAVAIASDNPPLPEFFSDCAAYYEAGKKESLAKAIISRLGLNCAEREAVSERSRKRSDMFSWKLTADMTMSVLMKVFRKSKDRV